MNDHVPLTSVHTALALASSETRPQYGTPFAFRIDETIRDQADQICQRHGVKLQAFLRQCCASLVEDYNDPTRA